MIGDALRSRSNLTEATEVAIAAAALNRMLAFGRPNNHRLGWGHCARALSCTTAMQQRGFCRTFFDWYNHDYHHCRIGLMTPDQVHYGQIDAMYAARQVTLDQAFRANPEGFVKKPPIPPNKPTATWINPPTPKRPT